MLWAIGFWNFAWISHVVHVCQTARESFDMKFCRGYFFVMVLGWNSTWEYPAGSQKGEKLYTWFLLLVCWLTKAARVLVVNHWSLEFCLDFLVGHACEKVSKWHFVGDSFSWSFWDVITLVRIFCRVLEAEEIYTWFFRGDGITKFSALSNQNFVVLHMIAFSSRIIKEKPWRYCNIVVLWKFWACFCNCCTLQ